jgi:hypothetical protein
MADTDRMMMIKVDLGIGAEQSVEDLTPRELGDAMEPEVRQFDQWFQKQGNEPLVRAETAIIKTYLGWKIKFEGKS